MKVTRCPCYSLQCFALTTFLFRFHQIFYLLLELACVGLRSIPQANDDIGDPVGLVEGFVGAFGNLQSPTRYCSRSLKGEVAIVKEKVENKHACAWIRRDFSRVIRVGDSRFGDRNLLVSSPVNSQGTGIGGISLSGH